MFEPFYHFYRNLVGNCPPRYERAYCRADRVSCEGIRDWMFRWLHIHVRIWDFFHFIFKSYTLSCYAKLFQNLFFNNWFWLLIHSNKVNSLLESRNLMDEARQSAAVHGISIRARTHAGSPDPPAGEFRIHSVITLLSTRTELETRTNISCERAQIAGHVK